MVKNSTFFGSKAKINDGSLTLKKIPYKLSVIT